MWEHMIIEVWEQRNMWSSRLVNIQAHEHLSIQVHKHVTVQSPYYINLIIKECECVWASNCMLTFVSKHIDISSSKCVHMWIKTKLMNKSYEKVTLNRTCEYLSIRVYKHVSIRTYKHVSIQACEHLRTQVPIPLNPQSPQHSSKIVKAFGRTNV